MSDGAIEGLMRACGVFVLLALRDLCRTMRRRKT
jgi:hypothetical protein